MRLAAFDTSLRQLGVAYGYLNEDFKLVIEATGTFDPDSVVRYTGIASWELDHDIIRMNLMRDYLKISTLSYKPDAMVIERPFFNGKNPKSLISQSKAWGLLDEALHEYTMNEGSGQHTIVYQPIYIKQMSGVKSSEYKDKNAMANAIERHVEKGNVIFLNESDLPEHNKDHSWDAICMLITLRETMLLDKEGF